MSLPLLCSLLLLHNVVEIVEIATLSKFGIYSFNGFMAKRTKFLHWDAPFIQIYFGFLTARLLNRLINMLSPLRPYLKMLPP